uniref:Uncharacterized protein n=1 Tax=Rhizophora mucronata TaxID=61149 RepID=A0A2P2MB47_RHIMU
MTGGPRRLPFTVPPFVFSSLKVCFSQDCENRCCKSWNKSPNNWVSHSVKFPLYVENNRKCIIAYLPVHAHTRFFLKPE